MTGFVLGKSHIIEIGRQVVLVPCNLGEVYCFFVILARFEVTVVVTAKIAESAVNICFVLSSGSIVVRLFDCLQ